MPRSLKVTRSISVIQQNNSAAEGQQTFPVTNLNNTQQTIASNVKLEMPDRSVSLNENSFRKMTIKEMKEVFGKLSLDVEIYLEKLLSAKEIGHCDSHPTMVVGDADGSTIRLMLAGLMTGKIKINSKGIEQIKLILPKEAKATENDNTMISFQEDEKIQGHFEELFENIKFQESDQPLIFLGDIEHDRLSCNKDINRKVVKELNLVKAIFIKGNHDYSSDTALNKVESGKFALDTADDAAKKKHEISFYKIAHYDEKAKTLYIHQGLAIGSKDDTFSYTPSDNKEELLITPYGPIPMPDPESIAQLMKDITKQHDDYDNKTPERVAMPYYNCKKIEEKDGKKNIKGYESVTIGLHHFRPSDPVIRYVANKFKIRIVHGHNGNFDPNVKGDPSVITVNSRILDSKKLMAVAVSLGPWPPEPQKTS